MRDWFENNKWDAETLQELLADCQALLPTKQFSPVIESIPSPWNETATVNLLKAIRYYDRQHKSGDSADWQGAFHQFAFIAAASTPRSALESFYAHNYSHLCLLRAKGETHDAKHTLYTEAAKDPAGTATWHFLAAEDAALQIQEPRCYQLLGFLYFNESRRLAAIAKTIEKPATKAHGESEAFRMYVRASDARVSFYRAMREADEQEAMIAAATEVLFMTTEFQKNFPGRPDTDCPIRPGLRAELESVVAAK